MNAREWEAHQAVAVKAGKDNARSKGRRPFKVDGRVAFPVVVPVGYPQRQAKSLAENYVP